MKRDQSYSQRAKSAVLWNTVFNLLRDILQFAQMVVLARLLPTDAYGLFAFSMSVIGFVSIFAAPTFLSHTLQAKSDEEVNYQLHFSAAVVIQIVIFIGANLIGILLSSVPRYANASPFVHVLSLTFLLDAACELRRKMLERNMDFRSLRLLHAVGLVLATIASIAMGMLGCGAYSLVVPTFLVTVPFIYDLFLVQKWRPSWEFSWEEYRPAFFFGSARVGAGVLNQGRVLIESAALTAALGFANLGIFNRAVGLAALVCTKISSQVLYAVYPILTRLDVESGQATRVGNALFALLAWIVIPAGVAVSWCATPAILTVYGGQWKGVIPLIGWAIAVAILSAITTAAYQLMLARNFYRLCLVADCIWLVGTCISLWLFLPNGTTIYLFSQAIVQSILLICYFFVLLRFQSVTMRGILEAFGPALLCSLGAAVVSSFLARQNLCLPQTAFNAVLWGVLFALFYCVGIRFIFARLVSDLIRYMPGHSFLRKLLLLPT